MSKLYRENLELKVSQRQDQDEKKTNPPDFLVDFLLWCTANFSVFVWFFFTWFPWFLDFFYPKTRVNVAHIQLR